MMKIVQLVPAMEQGGVERGVVEMNKVLVASGRRNIVISAGGRLVGQLVRDGACHIRLDVKSKNPLTFFYRAWRLRRILKRERPDVACVHSRVPAWLFRFAARGLGIPWISFAHGANSISRYSKVMTAGDIILAPSHYIARYLSKAYAIKEDTIRVIPRAIDRARFDVSRLDTAFIEEKRKAWGIAEGQFTVMALGRITQLKGFDKLIEAMALLKNRFRLVIVGEAEALRKDVERDLHELVRKLCLEERVVFAGNQSKVAECLTIANVVVSSNVRKPEAFGRSMAEALAMDKPVIARAFGGALDVVRDGNDGILIKGDDATDWPAAFAEAIRKVSEMEFTGLRESALERFSFEKMAASSLALYDELYKMRKVR